jgi:meso-butanediol dehydrogenase/(S,S)-butanediol dehydrogenase/diacetyl reductase
LQFDSLKTAVSPLSQGSQTLASLLPSIGYLPKHVHDGGFASSVDVAINDIGANQAGIDEVVKAVEDLGRKSVGVAADVSDSDETDRMIQEVVAKLGRLDVAIANAGIAHIAPILDTTAAERRNMVNVNCEGLMNTYISAAKQMKKQGVSDTYRIIGAASIVR